MLSSYEKVLYTILIHIHRIFLKCIYITSYIKNQCTCGIRLKQYRSISSNCRWLAIIPITFKNPICKKGIRSVLKSMKYKLQPMPTCT